MARQVEMVIQGKQFPYRTKGDIFRHALHRHVKWLMAQADIPSVMGQVDTIMEILRDEESASDFSLVFDKLGERISAHLSGGSEGEARRLVLLVYRHVEDMPDGYWKEKYQGEIKGRYGHILKGAKTAGLNMDGKE